jgi:Methyltransferase domain
MPSWQAESSSFTAMTGSLTSQLRADPPALHESGASCAGLHWPALEWIERTVQPGWATLETGAGLSTIVFASRAASHEAVTPAGDETARIQDELHRRGIPADGVRFHVGTSDEVLPRWEARPLDLVLLDGAHGFPYPVLDWWYLAPHIEPGGLLLLDDAYMAGVSVLLDYLRSRPSWRVEEAVGFRTVVVRKLRQERPPFDSLGEEGGRPVSFGYLPPHRRAVASARHRIFSTRAGLAVVRATRKHASFLFRSRA